MSERSRSSWRRQRLRRPAQVLEPTLVAAPDSGDADVVQRVRPQLVDVELVGHRERLATGFDPGLVVLASVEKREMFATTYALEYEFG